MNSKFRYTKELLSDLPRRYMIARADGSFLVTHTTERSRLDDGPEWSAVRAVGSHETFSQALRRLGWGVVSAGVKEGA